MRVLFLCSEYEGLIKTGGLADACRGLAQALLSEGHTVTVVLPCYAPLYPLRSNATNTTSVYFDIAGRGFGCAAHQLQHDGVNVVLIEHHELFNRERPYDDGEHAYSDNPLRFAFYAKAALQWALQQNDPFDLIHGHDWQTGAAAYYLKHQYRQSALAAAPFVFSIHNGAYQQQCAGHWRRELDIAPEENSDLNFLECALQHADKLNTVSKGYRDELMAEPSGQGLAALYQRRANDFVGILNGCDYQSWDPSTDQYLAHHFDATNLSGKRLIKEAFCAELSLSDNKKPLLVAVSRLTGQKGYDYLIPALARWLGEHSANVVIMGTGEGRYCAALSALQQQYPDNFRFVQGFSEAWAHKLEAAGDFFLMPSLFEPCGLNQLYSLRYGTVPVVRLTGGLKDTVKPWPERGATGIGFNEPSEQAVYGALSDALTLYNKAASYKRIQQKGMQQNFSWQKAAEQYLSLYQAALAATA